MTHALLMSHSVFPTLDMNRTAQFYEKKMVHIRLPRTRKSVNRN